MTKPIISFLFSLSLFLSVDETLGFSTFSSRNNLPFQPKLATSTKNYDAAAERQSSLCFWSTPQQRDSYKLFMGWGPDPIWTTAKVSSSTSCSPSNNFIQVTVDVDPEVLEGYKVAGQYVQLKEDDSEDAKPLFLAIASPPADADSETSSDSKMEFLIKCTDNNGWITSAADGKEVQISQVLGGGFPMEENFEGFKYDFPCQNVLLFANGSGIAPLRAAIESSQLGVGEGGRSARLYYGVSSPADMPYADKFKEWETKGVEVVPVVSRPEECDWNGRSGYVQNALEEDGVPIPRNTGALLCGVKGMAESVKDLLSKAGVLEGRVLTNF